MNETLSTPTATGTETAATAVDTVEIRDDDGQLRHSVRLQDGELHGHVESFDERGQLLQRATYQDGLRHGGSEYRDDGRLQMKQLATARADKFEKFDASSRLALATGALAAEAAGSDEKAAPVETLVLDAGLGDTDAQLLWQHRQSEGKMNSGEQAGAGGSAATAERSNIDLRTEQYTRLSERLAESLGQRLAAQIAKGEWKVEMALHPAELGNIDVKLNMNKGQLEANFSASQPATQALIADGLPKLKEVLAQLGMEVASMQVNVRQQGQNGGNPTPRREPSGVAGVSSKRGGDGNATAAATPAPRSGGITNDGLDLLA